MPPSAAAVCTSAPVTTREPRTSTLPSGTHTLMLRVVDVPAANDIDTALPGEVSQRVRVFDRVRLLTSRLARFELQLAPVGSNGVLVGG